MHRRSVQLVLSRTAEVLRSASRDAQGTGFAGALTHVALRPAACAPLYTTAASSYPQQHSSHSHTPSPVLALLGSTYPGSTYTLAVPYAPAATGSRPFHAHAALLHADGVSKRSSSKAPVVSDESATAEDTDRIVAELRYRNISVPRSLDISWGRRVDNLVRTVARLTAATVRFTLSIPGVVFSYVRMSPSEWWATLKGAWATVKHEGAHYYAGFRLFGFELRVATRLVFKQLRGGEGLTRREKKQLTRTTADIFRMVPFSLFIIVPFAELLLPIALKLFPNMLPSTFQSKLKEEEDLKKLLKVKTELARFLQQTVGELAKDLKSSSSTQSAADAKELYNFLKDVRAGESVSNSDILRFARLFDDALTLDNLDRVHLVTLCQFVGLSHLGTNDFLRMRLRTHLNAIKADDMEIKAEGGAAVLTDDELRSACRSRGMSAPFGSGCTELMRKNLCDWMELSLERNLPPSLLLLSRAFKLSGPGSARKARTSDEDAEDAAVQSLKDTIGMLPEETIEDVEMESFNSRNDMAKRLEYLKREEEIIQTEAAASEELAAARAELESSEDRLADVQTKQVSAQAKAAAQAVMREAMARTVRSEIGNRDDGSYNLKEGESREEQLYRAATEEKRRMKKIISALISLSSASGVSAERALFMEVAKDEVAGMLTRMATKGSAQGQFTQGQLKWVRPQSESVDTHAGEVTDQVSKYVSNILIRVEADIDRADTKIGAGMHLIDLDGDGMIDRAELQAGLELIQEDLSKEEVEQLMELIGTDNKVCVKDLQAKLAEADQQL